MPEYKTYLNASAIPEYTTYLNPEYTTSLS